MKNHRYLWFLTGAEKYGLQTAVMNLAGAVRDRGHTVRMASFSDGKVVEQLRKKLFDVDILNLPPPPRFTGSIMHKASSLFRFSAYAKKYRPALEKYFCKVSPQVVHWMGAHLTLLLPPMARAAGALPIWEIPQVLGTSDRLKLGVRRYRAMCIKHQVLTLANSQYTANSLNSPNFQAEVFHLGVDASQFDPQQCDFLTREELGIPSEAIVLGISGRLEPRKGQHLVWQAICNLLQSRASDAHRDLHLLLLGGPLDSEVAGHLLEIANRHNSADRLHLLGHVSYPQRYYGAIDVPMNAYTGAEGFGLTIIEAMLMARPVAVHALGGPAETVIDGKTGWHLTESTVQAWQTGLKRILADRHRWPEMGAAARQHALAHFTSENQAARYLKLVHSRLTA